MVIRLCMKVEIIFHLGFAYLLQSLLSGLNNVSTPLQSLSLVICNCIFQCDCSQFAIAVKEMNIPHRVNYRTRQSLYLSLITRAESQPVVVCRVLSLWLAFCESTRLYSCSQSIHSHSRLNYKQLLLRFNIPQPAYLAFIVCMISTTIFCRGSG